MSSEDVVKLTELRGKIADVVGYIDSLSYTKNLFNHVTLTAELLNALLNDIDTKLAKDAEDKKAAEEKAPEDDKTSKKKAKVN